MIFKKLLNNKVKEIAEQRKVLTETFPYTDWKKIPYTQYNKFLSLKDLIGECGVVWTNAFGRSNTEAEETRKYLRDYSKYYEYAQNFSTFAPLDGIPATITETSINVTNTQESGSWIIGTAISNYVNQEWKVYVESDNDISNLSFQFHNNQSNIITVRLQKGVNIIPVQTFTDQTRVVISVPVGISVTLTQIPNEVANERDIELFNFGYSKRSGYNGYIQDFRNWAITDETATIVRTEESVKISGNTGGWVVALWNVSTANTYGKEEWTVNLHIEKSSSNFISLLFYSHSKDQIYKTISLHEGKNIIPALTEEEYSDTAYIRLNVKADSIVTLTQITPYQGALVSDGIDDYGQCVKDFALPTDYTVVAMREIMNDYGCVASRMNVQTQGAFIFENQNNNVFSYGAMTVVGYPKLFSYQTKNSYNGTDINAGTSSDSEIYKLNIFYQSSMNNYLQAALYSFGIFSRTLTTEELALVEDCMYLELEYNTNILDGVEYYDILDARYRSNEEAEDKRNKWVGRFGKLHMTLNNYAYSQMSGWNGWPLPRQCTFSVAKQGSSYWLSYMGAPATVKTNSWGIRIVSNPTGDPISLIYISSSNTVVKTIALNEGTVNIIPPMTEDFANLAFSLPNHPVGSVVEFEQIPLYGGALVSDGVDDYAVSDEVIDEEIGGVVLHCTDLREADDAAGYAFGNSWQLNSIFGYFSTSSAGVNGMTYGDTKGNDGEVTTARTEGKDLLFGFSREPSFHGYPLYISRLSDASSEYGKIAFYQLRLIKSQPTETQLEVIKQQVLREHNDYLKEMGWK